MRKPPNDPRRDADEWLEKKLTETASRMRAAGWPINVWRNICRHDTLPATRRRILAHLLCECTRRGEALPQELAEWLTSELGADKKSSERVCEPKLKDAAVFEARNPGASLKDIAKAIGLPEPEKKKQRISDLQATREYQSYYADEKFLMWLDEEKNGEMLKDQALSARKPCDGR